MMKTQIDKLIVFKALLNTKDFLAPATRSNVIKTLMAKPRTSGGRPEKKFVFSFISVVSTPCINGVNKKGQARALEIH